MALALALSACGRTVTRGSADAGSDGDAGCTVDSPCAPEGIYPGPCVVEHDTGVDGVAESRHVYQYDARCSVSRADYDFDGDGYVDSITFYEYDERNLLERETRTDGEDWNEIWMYEYDENGNLVLWEIDLDADGVVDERREIDRNEEGLVVEERGYRGVRLDFWTLTTYDGDGRAVLVEEHQNMCIDGTMFDEENVVRRTTTTHRGDGSVVIEEVDGVECEIADGDIDMRTERVYDDSGNVLSREIDGSTVLPDTVDGVFESCTAYTYDETGNPLTIARDGLEGGLEPCDGIIDGITIHSYEEGRLVRIEYDNDADGVAEEVRTYGYDACGNNIAWSIFRGSEGEVVRHTLGYACWE